MQIYKEVSITLHWPSEPALITKLCIMTICKTNTMKTIRET